MTLEDAQNAARKAVQFDSQCQYRQALYYYNVAIKFLVELQNPVYDQKVSEYQERVSIIHNLSEYFKLIHDICFQK